jgi:hypothetical protein
VYIHTYLPAPLPPVNFWVRPPSTCKKDQFSKLCTEFFSTFFQLFFVHIFLSFYLFVWFILLIRVHTYARTHTTHAHTYTQVQNPNKLFFHSSIIFINSSIIFLHSSNYLNFFYLFHCQSKVIADLCFSCNDALINNYSYGNESIKFEKSN